MARGISGPDDMETRNGNPYCGTLRRVFGLTRRIIDGEACEQCFAAQAASRADASEDEVVAIDGDATSYEANTKPSEGAVASGHACTSTAARAWQRRSL